ncbi:MAG: hypothetical protein A2X28_00005 [Elusimicrobia bacterium GWA2_56_46]|nr:MAG: hypothetical protein A2X28_00005 [Elusimicrobia bacterium GWA2_56_46]OGR53714.1 MAG: hypothetical protein A2X39_03085 [Elusimicrobia bacterium GWC2_56_31]HBB67651.1 phosphate/phosphite/phosphonate ABC transporter substrate-binding protein [Elusimicrobiota bacterium]HBW23146.1 phosphate/phosphite/phosphonate ABC transporter substrate-binding protein [Elusimicrobiota bacterium]
MNIRGLAAALAAALCFTCFVPVRGAEADKPLTLIVHPFMAATDLHKRFRPLADFLGGRLGRPVAIVIAKNYDEQIDAVGRGEMDLAYMGPAPYVTMTGKYGRKTILGCFETGGRSTFHGVIFVAKDSPVRTLAGLKGRSFAFGDKNSTMGHLIPLYALWKAGVTAENLGKHAFLGKHDNVALGVLSGDFDGGAMIGDIFQQYEKRGLRKLADTPEIPEHVLLAGRRISVKDVSALHEALYGLKNTKEGLAVIRAIRDDATGIVPADDKDYDMLRVIMRQLAKLGVK